MADGRWRAFCAYRKGLMDVEGVGSADALDGALRKFCPEFASGVCGDAGGDTGAGVGVDSAKGSGSVRGGVRDGVRNGGRKLVDASVFAGKPKVGAADEVLWVAKNLTVDVGPEDAPGELAWNFLVLCRESPEFKVKFMLNIASDVVKRRSDEDDADKGKWDGVKQYDLCDAVARAEAFSASASDGFGAAGEDRVSGGEIGGGGR